MSAGVALGALGVAVTLATRHEEPRHGLAIVEQAPAVSPPRATFTRAQLDARAARIRAGRDPLSRYGRDARVDVRRNRVVIAASPPPGVRDPMVLFVPR